MPTHTATIRTIDRDPTRRLITLVLDHNPTLTAVLTYRQAAQLPFWLKPGQRVEVTGTLNEGDLRDNILHITDLRLISEPYRHLPPAVRLLRDLDKSLTSLKNFLIKLFE